MLVQFFLFSYFLQNYFKDARCESGPIFKSVLCQKLILCARLLSFAQSYSHSHAWCLISYLPDHRVNRNLWVRIRMEKDKT